MIYAVTNTRVHHQRISVWLMWMVIVLPRKSKKSGPAIVHAWGKPVLIALKAQQLWPIKSNNAWLKNVHSANHWKSERANAADSARKTNVCWMVRHSMLDLRGMEMTIARNTNALCRESNQFCRYQVQHVPMLAIVRSNSNTSRTAVRYAKHHQKIKVSQWNVIHNICNKFNSQFQFLFQNCVSRFHWVIRRLLA